MQRESDWLMAIIDTLRFRNILVNGKIAEDEPAQEFVNALDEALEDVVGNLATKPDLTAFKAEILAAIAQSDAANARGRLTLFIAIAALIATAIGLILGLN